ncbi:MAG: alpha/beta hydrolase [Pirellulaceae bacterium]
MKFVLFATLALIPATSLCQTTESVIPLWENGAPGFEDRKGEAELAESYWVKNVHNPSLTVFLPPKEKATGAAVVICPGGGHRLLVFNAEGVDAAKYLNDIGVAAFVLKYRLAREEGSPYDLKKHPQEDGQRAMRLVRSRAKEWGIDPTRIGMLGFSAGGEVVSTVAYGPGAGDEDATDPIERVSCRPDFQLLVYPGPLGVPEKIPAMAPPAFLIVANDDRGASRVIADLFRKYREAQVPVEAHIYARGGHAFNMGYRTELKTLKGWPARMHDWMADNFILDTTGRDEWRKKQSEGGE